MARKKKPDHPKCRRIAAVEFDGGNFICAGESEDSTFACDRVRLCVKGVVGHRIQEMTLREAETIMNCLAEAVRDISGRGGK